MMFRPSRRTDPTSGESKPAIMRRRVVFPQPEGPRREKNSPFLISILTLSRALKAPYARDTSLTVTSKPFNVFPLPPSSHVARTPLRRPLSTASTLRIGYLTSTVNIETTSFRRDCPHVPQWGALENQLGSVSIQRQGFHPAFGESVSDLVSRRRDVATGSGPVRMEEFTSWFVHPFVRMGAEVVALRLQQIRRQRCAAVAVEER